MNDVTRDVITAVLVLTGALMCFAAGVGVIRFPDVLARLHAATKPQILGLMAVTLAVAVNTPTLRTLTLAVAVIVFQALTAPMAAHAVGRSAYESGQIRPHLLIVDELGTQRRRRD